MKCILYWRDSMYVLNDIYELKLQDINRM